MKMEYHAGYTIVNVETIYNKDHDIEFGRHFYDDDVIGRDT